MCMCLCVVTTIHTYINSILIMMHIHIIKENRFIVKIILCILEALYSKLAIVSGQ